MLNNKGCTDLVEKKFHLHFASERESGSRCFKLFLYMEPNWQFVYGAFYFSHSDDAATFSQISQKTIVSWVQLTSVHVVCLNVEYILE